MRVQILAGRGVLKADGGATHQRLAGLAEWLSFRFLDTPEALILVSVRLARHKVLPGAALHLQVRRVKEHACVQVSQPDRRRASQWG